MCFSASASFTASAVLGILGTISLIRCRTQRARMIAAIPFLFSIQQFAEGIVWLAIRTQSNTILYTAVWIFLLFAFVIWPLWIPISALRYERIKRPGGIAVAILALMGGVISWIGLSFLYTNPLEVQADCCHIIYKGLSSLTNLEFAAWIYLLVTSAPFILSSKKIIQMMGIAIIASYAFTAIVWEYAFTSIWCFFAAILSASIAFYSDKL